MPRSMTAAVVTSIAAGVAPVAISDAVLCGADAGCCRLQAGSNNIDNVSKKIAKAFAGIVKSSIYGYLATYLLFASDAIIPWRKISVISFAASRLELFCH